MFRKLFVAALAATVAVASLTAAKPPKVPAPVPDSKPPVPQGIVPNTPSDAVSDFGLGATGYVLSGQGYVISKVKKNGPAKRVGLEAGDIIRSVDGVAIISEAKWTLAMKNKDQVMLKVMDSRDAGLPGAPLVSKRVTLK